MFSLLFSSLSIILRTMEKNMFDVVIGPGDGPFCAWAALETSRAIDEINKIVDDSSTPEEAGARLMLANKTESLSAGMLLWEMRT